MVWPWHGAQVVYLGYPGSSGAAYMDYLVADRVGPASACLVAGSAPPRLLRGSLELRLL